MLDEHAVVRLTRDRPREGVAAGQLGTIVMRYATDPPAYEVEFRVEDADPRSGGDNLRLVLLTVEEADLALEDA